MFERYLADKHLQQHRKDQQAIAKYTGTRYEPDYRAPEGWHRPDQRRRSPVHTQYKRLPETQAQDQQARELRVMFGYTYQEIAELMGYSSRQIAHKAVVRAEQDRIISRSQGDKVAPLRPNANPNRHKLPAVNITKIIPKAKHAGFRGCGCHLKRGCPVVYVDGRQWCLLCGLEHAGLTWGEIQREPMLMMGLQLRLNTKKTCQA